MRKIAIVFSFLACSLFSSPSLRADSNIQRLSDRPPVEVHPPEVTIQTLSNGMKVYLLEDHELPVFQMAAFVRGGAVNDPADKVGLASMVGTTLRTGGTKKRSVEEIDRFLDNRGASLDTGMAGEYGTAGLQGLVQDIGDLVPLFFEVLSSPRFDPGQVELARMRKIEGLKRQNDDPEKIAFREFPKLLYGDKSPWARTPSRESLQKISRDDLLHFHDFYYHPDRVILAVSGDFKKDDMIRLLEKSAQGWGPAGAPLPPLEPVRKEWEGGVFGINKKGVQSTVVMGHFGEKRFNPDKFALILMNYMLGGDIFSSRLGEEVRSDRGLAYSIFSHFGLETELGLFYVIAQTRSETTGEVVGLVQKEIARFHDGLDLSESALQFAKGAILLQLAGDWEPRFNYVKERARLGFYGYPENYLDIYRKKLGEVTLAQVKEAARKYLFPEKLKILVVGDLQTVDGQLKKFGELKTLPLDGF